MEGGLDGSTQGQQDHTFAWWWGRHDGAGGRAAQLCNLRPHGRRPAAQPRRAQLSMRRPALALPLAPPHPAFPTSHSAGCYRAADTAAALRAASSAASFFFRATHLLCW